jgi:hypothetical protein
MTLAVAWTSEHGDKKYGLTVAHAFADHGLTVGDSVFAFDSDDEVVGKKAHKSIKIGTIVSLNTLTDSVVFEIFPSIAIDPLAVALSGGDDQVYRITLPIPETATADPLPYGQRLVMFGAAQRVKIGARVQPTGGRADDISARFATMSYVATAEGDAINGETKLSYGSDCGALYLDANGTPWCMHTTIQGVPIDNPRVWMFRGALLQHIVDRHPFDFGHTLPISGCASNSSSNESQSSPAELQDGTTVSIAVEKIINSTTGGLYPRLYFPDEELEEDCFIEKQPGLPMSRIPMYFSDDDDDDDTTNTPGVEEEEKKHEN